MIEIKSLASGSSGNCYWISDGVTPVLLEAGISISEIKRGTGFRLSEIGGCLISHEHGDHIKSAVDVAGYGINCYMSKGTFMNYGFGSHRFNIVKPNYRFEVGSWIVKPFEIQHDAAEPMGFLLWSQETKDKLVYITDSYYSRYKFHRLNYIMLECNYSIDILNENIIAGRVPAAMKKRIIQSHFSLENVKDFLKANDLTQVREIWLLHLSDQNSNARLFKKDIQSLTGKPVYVAGGEY